MDRRFLEKRRKKPGGILKDSTENTPEGILRGTTVKNRIETPEKVLAGTPSFVEIAQEISIGTTNKISGGSFKEFLEKFWADF